MSMHATAPSPYRHAVRSAAVQQVIILILAGMILDGGETGRICLFAAVAFWGGVAVIRLRRRTLPTKVDLTLIEGGYIVLCVIAYFLTHWIWHLRGF